MIPIRVRAYDLIMPIRVALSHGDNGPSLIIESANEHTHYTGLSEYASKEAWKAYHKALNTKKRIFDLVEFEKDIYDGD